MSVTLVSVLVALLGGIAVGLQNPLASLLGRSVGVLEAAFIVHLGGAVIAGVPLALLGTGGLERWREVPWYAVWAGGLGVVMITAMSWVIPRIGVAAAIALVLTAQLTLGALFDHFGVLGAPIRPVDPGRVAGVALLLGGAWLVLR